MLPYMSTCVVHDIGLLNGWLYLDMVFFLLNSNNVVCLFYWENVVSVKNDYFL